MDEKQKPALPVKNLDEPIGNLVRIFPELETQRDTIKNQIEQTYQIKNVEPLEYFINVGNGMNVAKQQKEINKIIPPHVIDNKERAKLALEYLESGNHIGVSQEQFERDLKNGKDHDATMRFFLEKVLANEKLDPCIVVITEKAKTIFGENIEKIIIDGTHRAVIATLTNTQLEVLEFKLA